MSKLKPSINALKGYNFQGTIYSYFLCLMDLKREIISIDAEITTDNNFDDIYINTTSSSYYFQVKNYSKIDFNKIIFNKDTIIVNSDTINVGSIRKADNNILLIKDLIIPKEKINEKIFGLNCYSINGYSVASYSQEEINTNISEMYKNEKRYIEIMHIADRTLNTGKFKIKIEDLPQLYLFEQKLQQETLLIRKINLDEEKKQICIVGSPGVGKSHLVNELELNKNLNNCIIERLWISEQDKDKYDRIKFDYFLRDLIYKIFGKAEIISESEVIEKLDDITLVIDGLDHVENYNNGDLKKFINFISKISDSRLIVMTRPLKESIPLETIELSNWTSDESNDYLKYLGIENYDICNKIFKICKGYPIITYYLAQHYLNNKNLPEIKEVNSIIEFYDSLIGDNLPELSVFMINDSYFKKNELKELLGNREYKVIEKTLDNYKYLFNINHDRIYFIHDSLNYYLRSKELNFLEINKDIIDKILQSINNDEFKYLTRIRYFYINNEDKIMITKKICKFSYLNSLLLKTIDYEAIQNIYEQIEYIISINKNCFDVYEYYEFILIKETLRRDHHIGFYKLIIERVKYYINNNLIDFDNIYSNGLLFSTYSLIVDKCNNNLENFFNNTFFDTDREIESLYDELKTSKNYFDILSKKIDINKYLKENIMEENEYQNKNVLIYLLGYLYIKKIKYKGYEKIVVNLINNDETKAAEECRKLFYKYNIRLFFIKSFLNRLKDYLFSLGVDTYYNYYKHKTLKELINEKSNLGSFYVNDYVCNYIRLANFEKRNIDIEDVCWFYFMYYNRKDYSMYTIPQALDLFVEKDFLSYSDAVKIISNAMDMSEKGIRTIMTDFYNIVSIKNFKILNAEVNICENNHLIISDLEPKRLNMLDKETILNYFFKHIINHYVQIQNINYEYLGNLLKCKYKKDILYYLDLYGFTIDNISIEEFDISKYEKNEDNSKFIRDRNYIKETDAPEIINQKISCIELAKYVDGWHNTLPYANLFECYSKETLKENIIDITYNACFGYTIYDMYANRFCMIGNYLLLLNMSEIDIDWELIFNIFKDFLEISLVL